MLELYIEGQCRKDIKRSGKRGKNLSKLWDVVDRLRKLQPLEVKHRVHRLSGNWSPYWECHLEPDWLLIYHMSDQCLYLVRTGTHSDLFG
jgi:mRNA interferase YafQ